MERQKGISLFLTIIILAVILAIVFGLSAILVGQIKTIREMGNSVIAFYAADTGVERVLKIALDDIRNGTELLEDLYIEPDIGNSASYSVEAVCCKHSNPNCFFGEPGVCPLSEDDPNCNSTFYCIRSVGTYSDTKRAIEVEVFPGGD